LLLLVQLMAPSHGPVDQAIGSSVRP